MDSEEPYLDYKGTADAIGTSVYSVRAMVRDEYLTPCTKPSARSGPRQHLFRGSEAIAAYEKWSNRVVPAKPRQYKNKKTNKEGQAF